MYIKQNDTYKNVYNLFEYTPNRLHKSVASPALRQPAAYLVQIFDLGLVG